MNTTLKINDGVTRTLLITCLTSDTRRVTIATNPVIHHGRKDWIEITTNGKYLWSFERHRYSVTVNHVMVATVKCPYQCFIPYNFYISHVLHLGCRDWRNDLDANNKVSISCEISCCRSICFTFVFILFYLLKHLLTLS